MCTGHFQKERKFLLAKKIVEAIDSYHLLNPDFHDYKSNTYRIWTFKVLKDVN